MNNSTDSKSYKTLLPIVGVAVLLVILSLVLWILFGSGADSGSSNTHGGSPDSATGTQITPPVTSESFTAIITGVDTDALIITLCRPGNTDFEEFSYTGATDIKTGYGEIISAAQLKPGNFVDVTVENNSLLTRITGSAKYWSYKNVRHPVIDNELRKITLGDRIYRYDDSLLVLNEGFFVGLHTLDRNDIISVYGLDNYAYLLKIVSGHGYLKLSNYDAFIGGVIYVGSTYELPITEDFFLTLAEGEYPIRAVNKALTASGTLKVMQDKTAVFDLSPFLPEPVQYGEISFALDPAAASVYIDGILTDTSKPVNVTFGNHYISAVLDGYTPYYGELTIDDKPVFLNIGLTPAPIITGEPDPMDVSQSTDTGTGTETVGDTDSGTDTDTDADTNAEPGTGTGTDAGPGTNTDTSAGSNADTGAGTDAGSGTNADTGTGAGTDSGPGTNADTNADSDSDADTGTDADASDSMSDNEPGSSDGDSLPYATLTVRCTEGAAVYANDIYKGTITNGSLVFRKPVGTVEIRFTLEGYTTKKYNIVLEDNNKSEEYTFPELMK